MNATVKKWLNRGGLAAVLVGVVLIIIGGGDVDATLQTAAVAATLGGALMVFIRELLG